MAVRRHRRALTQNWASVTQNGVSVAPRIKTKHMRACVSAFRLWRVIEGSSAFCLMAQICARARPRKTVTGERSCLIDFCRFRPQLQSMPDKSWQWPKTAEIDQALEGRGWASLVLRLSSHHCRTVSLKIIIGHIYADCAKRNLPATSQPAGECRPLCFSITAVRDQLRQPTTTSRLSPREFAAVVNISAPFSSCETCTRCSCPVKTPTRLGVESTASRNS